MLVLVYLVYLVYFTLISDHMHICRFYTPICNMYFTSLKNEKEMHIAYVEIQRWNNHLINNRNPAFPRSSILQLFLLEVAGIVSMASSVRTYVCVRVEEAGVGFKCIPEVAPWSSANTLIRGLAFPTVDYRIYVAAHCICRHLPLDCVSNACHTL